MPRPFPTLLALTVLAGGLPLLAARPAGAQTDGPAPGTVYSARKGDAQVRLVGLGESDAGDQLLLLDVKVECEGFEPEGRFVATMEEEGRFEVEGSVSEPGTTDVITGEFDDIDGKVRSDGAVLEIDVEVEGLDNAGPTGRCEETQQWRLEPRRSAGAARIDGATPTDASELASNGDALFGLEPGDDDPGELSRIDPQTLATTWTVDAPAGAGLLGAAGDAVWLFDGERLEVTRVGALTGDVEATIPLEDASVADATSLVFPAMTATLRAGWVAIDETQAMYRIDALTNLVTKIGVAGRIDTLAPAADGVFASVAAGDGGAARLVRFNDGGIEQATTPIEDLPDAMASDDVRVWPRSTQRLAAYEAQELELLGALDEERLSTGELSDLVLALAPGAWTPTTRGLEAFGDDLDRELDVPVVGAAATAMVAAEDAVFVLDSGYLMRVRASA